MIAIDPNFVTKLAYGLLTGQGSILETVLRKKLKQMSVEIFNQLTEGESGKAFEVKRRVQKPFNMLRRQWLMGQTDKDLTPETIYDRLEKAVRNGGKVKLRKRKRGAPSVGWKQSRQYWLGDDWRHDWRSQPRDRKTGRWIPGRLKHPYVGKGVRKVRAARRRAARLAFKNLKV